MLRSTIVVALTASTVAFTAPAARPALMLQRGASRDGERIGNVAME